MQIIYDMLVAIRSKNGRIKPTHLLYKSNLSYAGLKTYLDELKSNQLVREHSDKNGKTFSLTDKGYLFIERFELVKEFMEMFGFEEKDEVN